MTANPSQASSVSEPNGCDLHPDKGYAWCEDCNAAWSVWAQNRIQSLTAEKAALVEQVRVMREALTDARTAIASLDEFALGGVDIPDTHTGDSVGQYGIRDELLAKIDDASGAINREG
jgi:hypothetical protein